MSWNGTEEGKLKGGHLAVALTWENFRCVINRCALHPLALTGSKSSGQPMRQSGQGAGGGGAAELVALQRWCATVVDGTELSPWMGGTNRTRGANVV